ncbi:ornithine carbamoyltransferase [Novosphingobium sp.]|uniref:ornithine carbamoyltransferase n=1 Tax=Novosphingobium sp. TaxID=1874826 RepID=UPI003B52ADCB
MMRHFLNLGDAGPDGVKAILSDAVARKAARAGFPKGQIDADAPLAGRVLAMVFEKNSTRTRVSFDVGMRQLGGSAVVLDAGSSQLGRGESIADTARVLSRMADAIMLRTSDHAKMEELAHYATVPVINGLTDLSHPCQVMADLETVIEHGKPLAGLTWAWLGDGNNMLNSIVEASGLCGFDLRIGVPAGYDSDAGFIARAGAGVSVLRDPVAAVAGADIVVTDTWISMGQAEAGEKLAAMGPYQVNAALMAHAKADALFLHCLPAHRGEEVTDAVIDGPASVVWDEAENRIHAQKAILRWVFGQI